MYKVTAIFFSIFLIAISLAGLPAPGGELGMFLTINDAQTAGRLGLAFALLMSLFTANTLIKALLGMAAAGLMALTVVGLVGTGFYLLPIDLFIALEGTVLCLLGSARPATPVFGWAGIKRRTTELTASRGVRNVTQP